MRWNKGKSLEERGGALASHRAAHRLGAVLTRLTLAQDCLLCAAPAGDECLCPACAVELPTFSSPCCPRCAHPTPLGELCGACLKHPPHFETTYACWPYTWPVDILVQALKFGHRLAVARFLGRRMAAMLPAGLDALIIPVPLSAERLRMRGFNQALELARHLPGRLLPDACQRLRETQAQSSLPWTERRANVRAAFACHQDLTGATVLLVDDVMTTGATLNELGGTLRSRGAARVLCCVAARTLPS